MVEKSVEKFEYEPQEYLHVEKEFFKNRVRQKRNTLIRSYTNQIIPEVLHIEIAIFVDKDLYRHMLKNFPNNTEQYVIRFILAMINGVQLLYHHP